MKKDKFLTYNYKSDYNFSENDFKEILKNDANFPLLCKLILSKEENQ